MRATLAHRRGEPEAALVLLSEALARDPAPMWHAWACVDAAWLNAEAGRSAEAARLLAQIEGTPATLPVVIAAQARVRHAAGDVQGALALHRQYVAARKEPGWNLYFNDLGQEYEEQSHAGLRPLPRTPFLPSRSC
jgi:tetratricopeptide (TPR) repeat protein